MRSNSYKDSFESLHASDLDLSGISDTGHATHSTDLYDYSSSPIHHISPIKQSQFSRGASLPTISPTKPPSSQGMYSKQTPSPTQNTCPICGEIYTNYSIFLDHVYGSSVCSEKFEESQSGKNNSKQASLALFSTHYRHVDATTTGLKIEHIAVVVSSKDQYSFGGKNACTSIACEFAIQLLNGVLDSERSFSWSPTTIDKVIECGCMQDPRLGNLSFEEVMNINNRMSSYLELVHPEIQKSVKGPSFLTTLETIESCSHQMRRPLCAIFTKQPETVLIFYNFKTGMFLLADSHPRETDDLPHGASVIFTRSLQSMAVVLKKWLFPFMDFDETSSNKGLSELYNTFSCSIVKLRSGTEFRDYQPASKASPTKPIISQQQNFNTSNTNTTESRESREDQTMIRDLMSELSSQQSENDQLKKSSQQNEEKIAKLKEKLEVMREKHLNLKRKMKDSKELKKSLESIESIMDNISPLLISDSNNL
ncbi:predicted protein [Naegleria gruberi]|uniref:Predicted protein n=1 Tax=Naegleria gruberi TaxID=5762 RepID=D2VRA0_NAEGR|nr:uncharacterized protein NAEGRDRAFT_71513 [Naegleria gruberi]EFC40636.1 predicted protein [Naegleria gruberi]|eukprot:XP_002673380.1 predicted protein [Naegleria gruberi strain NEG-M]